jgi:hypothetical protein
MSLWKDYDDTPPEIAASLFQNNSSRESNLHHSMFASSNKGGSSSISSSVSARKDRKSLFDEKVKISVSNGVNLFEEEEDLVLMRRSCENSDENDSYDLLYHEMKDNLQRNQKKPLQLIDGSSDEDEEEEDETMIIGRKEILEKHQEKRVGGDDANERTTIKVSLDYKQLYEEEYQRRVELEKHVEKLTKQLERFTKKKSNIGEEAGKGEQEEDEKMILQEKSLSAEERRNLQLQRLKKSAMGKKKKIKSESQPPQPQAQHSEVLPPEVKNNQKTDVEDLPLQKKNGISSYEGGNLFADTDSDSGQEDPSKSHGIPAPPAAAPVPTPVQRHQKNNLWESSDEEDSEETQLSGLKTSQSEDLKAQMERERLEKQKARQRQLNQRNRRGASGTSNSKRRVPSSASKSSPIEQEAEAHKDSIRQSQQSVHLSSHQTIPRTGGNNWSDDDDEEEDSDEETAIPSYPTKATTAAAGAIAAFPLPIPQQSPSSILDSESSLEQVVLSWCRGKDLVSMIHTLQEVPTMSFSTIELLRELHSHSFRSYDPQDVRKIYLSVLFPISFLALLLH